METVWSYVLGGVVVALVVGQFGWAARTLLRHAELLATITTQLKQLPDMQGEIAAVSADLKAVELEQVRVKTLLGMRP